jgi:hypothetical protein
MVLQKLSSRFFVKLKLFRKRIQKIKTIIYKLTK